FVLSLPRFQPTDPSDRSHTPRVTRPRGDLAYLNDEGAVDLRRWVGSATSEAIDHRAWHTPVPQGDDFVFVPLPRIAAGGPEGDRAADGALAAYEREVAVVDARLAHKVTLAFKATALSDLCDHLRADTGISLTAGRSVSDEKVTLFCRELPL